MAPRYWPVWLGLGLLRLMAALPFAWQLRLGRGLGQVGRRLARRRRHVVRVNLTLCFPDLSPAERERLLAEHFAALGAGLFETAMAWWAPDEQIRRLVRVEGVAHLDKALQEGRGVILLTGHFTTLELGARFLTRHCSFHAIYRRHDNPLFQTIMRDWRERRSGYPPLTRTDMRGMIRALRKGRAVWYAPDQNFGAEEGVFVPFFGVSTYTTTATARLARIAGARVVPYFPQRLPGTAGYVIRILPALEDFPSDDLTADSRRVNELIEAAAKHCPEQYYWVHRRFKSRPPGEKDCYR